MGPARALTTRDTLAIAAEPLGLKLRLSALPGRTLVRERKVVAVLRELIEMRF